MKIRSDSDYSDYSASTHIPNNLEPERYSDSDKRRSADRYSVRTCYYYNYYSRP
jgi:hypothetical protein